MATAQQPAALPPAQHALSVVPANRGAGSCPDDSMNLRFSGTLGDRGREVAAAAVQRLSDAGDPHVRVRAIVLPPLDPADAGEGDRFSLELELDGQQPHDPARVTGAFAEAFEGHGSALLEVTTTYGEAAKRAHSRHTETSGAEAGPNLRTAPDVAATAEVLSSQRMRELLQGHTLLCDCCGKEFGPDDDGARIRLSGSFADPYCSTCTAESEEFDARHKEAERAAAAAGGSFHYEEHLLEGFDGEPVFFESAGTLMAVAAQLHDRGVETLVDLGFRRLALKASDAQAVKVVLCEIQG